MKSDIPNKLNKDKFEKKVNEAWMETFLLILAMIVVSPFIIGYESLDLRRLFFVGFSLLVLNYFFGQALIRRVLKSLM